MRGCVGWWREQKCLEMLGKGKEAGLGQSGPFQNSGPRPGRTGSLKHLPCLLPFRVQCRGLCRGAELPKWPSGPLHL